MKDRIKELYQKTPRWLKNKYFLSAIIFFIWIFFFDTYSIMVQINQKKDMNKIIQDIEYYKEEISKDQKIIDIIKTDSLTPDFEKYLREVMFLSRKNEEIIIIK
tara:strand:- start:139 stop:450 length:312 start_codon:yes stop_codon:yes gene_type:complete